MGLKLRDICMVCQRKVLIVREPIKPSLRFGRIVSNKIERLAAVHEGEAGGMEVLDSDPKRMNRLRYRLEEKCQARLERERADGS